jgi:hypothetical protein
VTEDPSDRGPGDTANDDAETPRWVKVFGVVALVLVVAFALLHLAGGGFRGHMHP